MMNFAFQMMNFAFQMMNFAFQIMNFVFQMVNFAFQIMNFAWFKDKLDMNLGRMPICDADGFMIGQVRFSTDFRLTFH